MRTKTQAIQIKLLLMSKKCNFLKQQIEKTFFKKTKSTLLR